MTHLIKFCNQVSQLDESAVDDLLKHTTIRNYKKGDYIFRQGKVCEYLYFVNTGIVKCFFLNEITEKEYILFFSAEDSMFSFYDSATAQKACNFNIIALESSSITLIKYESMEELSKRHHCIETFYRKLLISTNIGVVSSICEMMQDSTVDRYRNFIEKNGQKLHRVSAGDMAKYFGVTPQSLSRIRAKKNHYLP